MVSLYRLQGKIAIKTACAQLWERTLLGPKGSVVLSTHENAIIYHLMLVNQAEFRDLVEVVYPDPWFAPENEYRRILFKTHLLNVRKLRPIGLEIAPIHGPRKHGPRALMPWVATPAHV